MNYYIKLRVDLHRAPHDCIIQLSWHSCFNIVMYSVHNIQQAKYYYFKIFFMNAVTAAWKCGMKSNFSFFFFSDQAYDVRLFIYSIPTNHNSIFIVYLFIFTWKCFSYFVLHNVFKSNIVICTTNSLAQTSIVMLSFKIYVTYTCLNSIIIII